MILFFVADLCEDERVLTRMFLRKQGKVSIHLLHVSKMRKRDFLHVSKMVITRLLVLPLSLAGPWRKL